MIGYLITSRYRYRYRTCRQYLRLRDVYKNLVILLMSTQDDIRSPQAPKRGKTKFGHYISIWGV